MLGSTEEPNLVYVTLHEENPLLAAITPNMPVLGELGGVYAGANLLQARQKTWIPKLLLGIWAVPFKRRRKRHRVSSLEAVCGHCQLEPIPICGHDDQKNKDTFEPKLLGRGRHQRHMLRAF